MTFQFAVSTPPKPGQLSVTPSGQPSGGASSGEERDAGRSVGQEAHTPINQRVMVPLCLSVVLRRSNYS